MFDRDAEEHYFGSIVDATGTKLGQSILGSVLAKAGEKRDLKSQVLHGNMRTSLDRSCSKENMGQ